MTSLRTTYIALAAMIFAAAPAVGVIHAQTAATVFPGADPGADEWYMHTPDSVNIYVRELGTGNDTVVVLHGGFAANLFYMLPAVHGLENKAHFVFYDQRGSLLSPAAASKISLQKHIDDLEQLRQELGLQRMTIIAHSMGTFLAMSYLQQHPEHVKGIILAGAIPPISGAGGNDSLFAGINRHAEAMSNRPEVTALIHKLGLDKPNLSDRDATHAWRIKFTGVNVYHVDRWKLMQGGGHVFYDQTAASAAGSTMPQEWDFTPVLRAHSCPVYVLIGNDDYVDWRVEHWRAVEKSVPNLRLRVMPDAGHSSWIDQPDLFRKNLGEALDASARCH